MAKITLENISINPLSNNSFIYDEHLYLENIKNLVNKVFPEIFDELDNSKKITLLNEALPIIKWSDINLLNSKFSVTLLCKQRRGAAIFFYDLISRWLVPDNKLPIDLFFMADFLFEGLNEVVTIAEVVVEITSENDRLEILKNKRVIDTEIRLGVTSDFHANRIMQFKGLSYDKKTSMIQEKIASLIQTRSKDFGQSIFSHMQQFLVTCSDKFKIERDYHHISRIISILFLMKKVLSSKVAEIPGKRHVNLKFLKTKIYSDKGDKEVLGIIVGINFLKEHEVFEKKHLLKAINIFLPDAIEVENSFFIDKNNESQIQTIYFEVEKRSTKDFTYDEIRKLKEELPLEIKSHIERLMHPIFMPRNEEEIVKNILTLSRQLKFVNDIPQVIITFDEQTSSDLSFTVILLRILKAKSPTVADLFKQVDLIVRFVPDRVKKVGILRRKYLKEANVFKALIPSQNYVRQDHSVDLNKARIDVIDALYRIFGEVRDYNGGMIYKQNEALNTLKSALFQASGYNELLLEKFFYSIRPVEMAVIIPTFSLKSLFLMLSNAIKREETRIKRHSDYLFKKEAKSVYAIIPVYDIMRKKTIKDAISKYYLLSSDFISFDLFFNDIYYLGYIFNNEDDIRQKNFLKIIQQVLDFEIKRS
jgi:hypothetical protein